MLQGFIDGLWTVVLLTLFLIIPSMTFIPTLAPVIVGCILIYYMYNIYASNYHGNVAPSVNSRPDRR